MYFFKKPTTTTASQVTHENIDLANLLCPRAEVVYVLTRPERNENKVRLKQVNDFLLSVGELKTKDQPLATYRGYLLLGVIELWPEILLGSVIFIPTTPHTSTKTVSITLEILLKKQSYTKTTEKS